MFASTLADRTAQVARDLAEALTTAPQASPTQPPMGDVSGQPPQPGPPGGPQLGPLPAPLQAASRPTPPGGGGPPGGLPAPMAQRPGQSMAMANLSMRPPTQNPMMGGLAQVKAFARGGLVRAGT